MPRKIRKKRYRRAPLRSTLKPNHKNKSNWAEIIPRYISAVGTLLLALLAGYAAFFSPLKDALQAELKQQALEATRQLEFAQGELKKTQASSDKLKTDIQSLTELKDEQLSSISTLNNQISNTKIELKTQRKQAIILEESNEASKIELSEFREVIKHEKINRAYERIAISTSYSLGLFNIDNAGVTYLAEDGEESNRGRLSAIEFLDFDNGSKYKTINLEERFPSPAEKHWDRIVERLNIDKANDEPAPLPSYNYQEEYFLLKNSFIKTCENKFKSIEFIFSQPHPEFLEMPDWLYHPPGYDEIFKNSDLTTNNGVKEFNIKVEEAQALQKQSNDVYKKNESTNSQLASAFVREFDDSVKLYENRLQSQRVECLSEIKAPYADFIKG